ncbi:hypothetical protein CROQUDRAFT_665726 [Cronartium quercuum f. sp. fusiforme G11]|uniref:Uncharacterized protein n=1 Tax=Cronartium quercuum f. sp. fusiforme G11 TaxID=708437 RepID=A0A9P6T733_9BASI|nr:hypothetical protein CROQUDRAFT_665726 [Cronartium quercuum f. sp. fusiforme G11]
MLDANLYTLSFVQSANEPGKLVLIEEGSGEPVYYRLRTGQDEGHRIELYHSLTDAGLASLHNLSSKLKLVSLQNPAAAIELRNSGYIHWEWTFEFGRDAKFCWRRDIVGLKSNKKGFTCWMVRKPDPDYPCAIYRPASSTSPNPSCQILDFNIRRIEVIEDRRGNKAL